MKNTITLILMAFLLFAATASKAQPGPGQGNKDRHEKVEALKIGYITQKLSLTPDEAKLFWPVYNKMEEEIKTLRKGMKEKAEMEDANILLLSDADAEKLMNDMISMRQKESEVIKKYSVELKKVIPVQKVILLFKAQEEFKRELLKQLKDRKK